MLKKLFFITYISIISCLFLYSFTQVDLNLTLSRSSWFQYIEKSFQYIGYFNRPLSTYLFILLLILLFSFYIFLLRMAIKKTITKKQIWIILIIVTIVLTFSYNAFSYDIFNYIFDAKIFTFYHQNPYLHRALDFPQDKMLNFMRWTHRLYPYGPLWLAFTVPLSYIGLQLFLPTFFLFKFLMAGSFLGTCYFIQKISSRLSPKNIMFNVVFFAFNPLVLIECLVSGHNDIVMFFFALIAIWFLITKKWFLAFVLLLISIGIKFATVFLLPVFILVLFIESMKVTKRWSTNYIFFLAAIFMIFAIIAAAIRTQFQPWYLLYALPFVSMVARKYYIIIPTIIVTFFALLEYTPYLYRGDWNPPVPMILSWITLGGIIISILATIGYKYLPFRK